MKPIDIIDSESPDYCCGVLCPRYDIQKRINRMQRVIDKADKFLNYGSLNDDDIQVLEQELKILSTS